jgi:ABC-type uncharacterized transport system fused permease/ATPase subunit
MSGKTYLVPDEKRLISRFWQSASGFWHGPSAWRAWFLIVLLTGTVLLQLLTQYGLNFWNRDFFNAIERREAPLSLHGHAAPNRYDGECKTGGGKRARTRSNRSSSVCWGTASRRKTDW